MQAWKLWVLGVLWVVGASCGGDVFIDEKQEPLCRKDSVCGNHHVCVNLGDPDDATLGRCEPGCRMTKTANTCGTGLGYVCVSAGSPNDATLGRCELGCRTNSDCGNERYVCVGQNPQQGIPGSCQLPAPKPEGCTEATEKTDCPLGYVCTNVVDGLGKCAPGCHEGEEGDTACGDSRICVKTKDATWSTCELGCRVGGAGDAACGDNRICVKKKDADWGTCELGCHEGAAGDTACGDNHICVKKEDATWSTCELGCHVGEAGDTACGDNYICVKKEDAAWGACEPGCRVSPTDGYENTCGAGSGYVCVNTRMEEPTQGRCVPGCFEEGDCAALQTCEDNDPPDNLPGTCVAI